MSILYRLSFARAWNCAVEVGCIPQAFTNIFKGTNQIRGCRQGIFDDSDDDSPKYNRRGAYVDSKAYTGKNKFRSSGRDSFHSQDTFDEDSDDSTKYNKRGGYVESQYNGRNNNRSFGRERNYNNFQYNRNKSFNRDYIQDIEHGFNDRTNSYQSDVMREPLGARLRKASFDLNNLPEVKKDLYIEHENVAIRSMEEIQNYRLSLNMNVKGTNVPKPITQFSELCLPESLMAVIGNQGYDNPTPIQAQGWPIALSGRDMIGISQTGSGKTLVFMLPAVVHATNQRVEQHRSRNECKPQVLVLAPTRELVQQIDQVSHKFLSACGLRSGCAYGGASKNVQLRYLRGAEICIATPGRLIDFVSSGLVSLEQCSYLVLDEADRMLDMGFEPQIRKIVDQIRPDRQTLMWSATWPQDIRNLAEEFLRDYIKVTVGTEDLSANPNIKQNIYVLNYEDKRQKIVALLKDIMKQEENKTLVFAQTKRMVDSLGYWLSDNDIQASCIHGDVSQMRRDSVLQSFRAQRSCVLIATDVAARGLDITDIQHVINYDFPNNIEDYIHRIGRTARGNSTGIAHSFFTHDDASMARELIAALKKTNQDVNPELYSIFESNRKPARRNNFTSRKFERAYMN